MRSPLHRSLNYESTKSLISNGADVNEQDAYGFTPLYNATTPEIASLLISAGADVNTINKSGETPLEYILSKADASKSDEYKERMMKIVKVLEDPCSGVVNLLNTASQTILDLKEQIQDYKEIIPKLESQIKSFETIDVIKKAKKPKKQWVCRNPYPKLTSDIQKRLNSCESDKISESDIVFSDRVECMKGCTEK